jgi:hypothetical protein
MIAPPGARLSERFATVLGARTASETAPGTLLGVEHEYQLLCAGDPVDFRELIHQLPVPGRRLDPGDANAYRLRNGCVLTCDEAEAEIATPPLALQPGVVGQVAAWTTAGREELERLLPAGIATVGYSTHLSISLPDEAALGAMDLFSRRFAPAVLLLCQGTDSQGIYVRPRPGRLELCGDHATGRALAVTTVFFAGAVRACAAALAGDSVAIAGLPPPLDVDLAPAHGRFGVYVGRRRAFGMDLLAAGPRAWLPVAGGGSIRADEHLAQAWQAARAAVVGSVGPEELAAVDAVVAGAETPRMAQATRRSIEGVRAPAAASHCLGAVLDPVRRPAFVVVAVIATWDFTIFQLHGRRQAYVCVPRELLSRFLQRLAAGKLDSALAAYLAAAPDGRRLQHHEQARAAALWDEVASGSQLLPPERDASGALTAPDTGSILLHESASVGRMGKGPVMVTARPGKLPLVAGPPGAVLPPSDVDHTGSSLPVVPLPPATPPPRPAGGSLGPVGMFGAATAVVLAVAAVAWGLFVGGTPPAATPTATPSAPPTGTANVRPTETQRATLTATPSPRASATPGSTATRPTATPRPLATTNTPTAITSPTGVPSPTLTPTLRTPEPTAAPATSGPPTSQPLPTETRVLDPTPTASPAPTAAVSETPAPTATRIAVP